MTRILLLFSAGDLGGAERSLTRMAISSQADQCEYNLATLAGLGDWVEWCKTIGLRPIVLGARPIAGTRHKISMPSIIELIKIIRINKYDAIYVIGLRAALMLRLLRPLLGGVKIVHGVRWNPASHSNLDRAFRFIERISSCLVDHYICNSKAAAFVLEYRLKIPANKISVIYNGIAELPPPNPALKSPPVALTIANLALRKGQLEYLGIIARMTRSADTKFVFVGRDGLGGEFQKRIEALNLGDCVTFKGFLDDVRPDLEEATVMVLPSLWNEGAPTSILESYAHGVPVVAYAIDGIPEIVVHGETGFLAKAGDEDSFGKYVEMLLNDPVLARKMGEAGRAMVQRSYTLEACANSHCQAFREIVSPDARERTRKG